MRLHNTLTGSVEPFDASGDVRMYVCGVTPYDTTHVGHARTYLIFDVLLRHLRRSGHRVRYVQNITDVDDSIVAKANDLGTSYRELGDRYTAIYFEDLAALGMLPPDAFPRATDHIPEMQDAITALLERGHAYPVDGDVFFRVSSVSGYGSKLARLDHERLLEIEASQDGTTVGDERKEDQLDFLLWRSSEEPPSWPSPWGPGRPGWHIECSTLAMTHLGPRIHIHGGGSDLVFPHHEAEIAQAESATGEQPFSRFWMHVRMVTLAGEKMSKSKGNMVFVRELLHRWSADALRLYLLETHYREPLDFSEEALAASAERAARLSHVARARGGSQDRGMPVSELLFDAYRSFDPTGAERDVLAALDDDLDTPAAITALLRVADDVDGGRTSASRLRDLASGRLGLRL